MEHTRDARLVMASMFVDTVGDGLWLAGGALFFHRAMGLPLVQVGLGLTIAGVAGLAAGVELARLADRHGARTTYFVLTTVQTLAFVAMVFIHSFGPFVVAAAVAAAMNQGAQATRSGIVRQLGGAQAVRFRAVLQAVMNVGISVGAVLAGVVISIGTHRAYDVLILADAGSFFLAGAAIRLTAAVPAVGVVGGARRWTALRDRAYVKVAAVDGVLDLEFGVSGYLLPLWVVTHTQAPRWFGSPLLLVNTVLVVLLQVRVARGADQPAGAALSFRRGSWLLALAAVGFAVTGHLGTTAAVILLVVAMAIHSTGEVLHAAGQFGLAFGLAPDHAVSEYQAVFSLGMGMSRAFAPAILTLLCLSWGSAGWVVLGVAFLAAGAGAPALTRRITRSRTEPATGPCPATQPVA